jgi:hypothetical protein
MQFSAKLTLYKRQIDKVVYELYALTDTEIAAMEGGKQIAAAINGRSF